jgi:hypothetical protein
MQRLESVQPLYIHLLRYVVIWGRSLANYVSLQRCLLTIISYSEAGAYAINPLFFKPPLVNTIGA